MSIYTNPPEWKDAGKKPPSSKRTEGWRPGDRVPASWLNWFWFSTVNSLREIAQAFVNHRDASAPHDGHETKEGATAKVEEHSKKTTAVHGVGQQYVAKTSRSDQWPSWNDIPDKPSTFPVDAATLPQASTSQAGIVQLTNSRSSTSEMLAVTAKALNDHRNSADHDSRYYTKSQLIPIIHYLALNHWTSRTSSTTSDLWGVAYANGLWVVVGFNGTIRTSANGTSWAPRTSGTQSDLWSVAYANGLWVAVGSNGTILTSTNGTSWTSRSSGTSESLLGVAYANDLWVVTGARGTILTSTNGTSWTSRSSGTTSSLYDVFYADGLWVVVGTSGTILTSTNGTSWTSRSSGTTSGLFGVSYANGLWVAVGGNGTILTSTNGTSWTSRSSGTSSSLYDVTYANGLWVVVGGRSNDMILASTDGTMWATCTSGMSEHLYEIIYADGLWVVVGASGTISTARTITP